MIRFLFVGVQVKIYVYIIYLQILCTYISEHHTYIFPLNPSNKKRLFQSVEIESRTSLIHLWQYHLPYSTKHPDGRPDIQAAVLLPFDSSYTNCFERLFARLRNEYGRCFTWAGFLLRPSSSEPSETRVSQREKTLWPSNPCATVWIILETSLFHCIDC